jgi:hypothetical protein
MASKSNFISEFRQSVSQMLQSYNKALDLAEFADSIGWDAAALEGQFTSSDITVTEFVTAMGIIKAIETANAGIAGDLSKLQA